MSDVQGRSHAAFACRGSDTVILDFDWSDEITV
jgi:hypothetical protein